MTTNGRKASHPVFITSTGAEVAHRNLSPDIMPKLTQACREELADSRPQPPKVEVDVAPGEKAFIENEGDPDYIEELRSWEQSVSLLRGTKIKELMENYALIYEVDVDAVREYREAMAAIGVDLSEESDRAIYLWHILIPDPTDISILIGALSGKRVEEAIRNQTDMFLRKIPGLAS